MPDTRVQSIAYELHNQVPAQLLGSMQTLSYHGTHPYVIKLALSLGCRQYMITPAMRDPGKGAKCNSVRGGAYQSRALSKYTSLVGIIKERKDSREYRGTMNISLTIYRCRSTTSLSSIYLAGRGQGCSVLAASILYLLQVCLPEILGRCSCVSG